MKYIVIACILMVTALAPVSVFAEANSKPRLISVSGDAEVRVVPDEVVFTLGVETSNKNLIKAKDENDQRVNSVLTVAKNHGIEEKHIQTDYLSIQPRYKNQREYSSIGGDSGIEGYVVRKTVVITLKDLSKFEILSSDVLEVGANYVHGIDFRTTELRIHRDQARELAIKAAKEKAAALAKELGQNIGPPYSIQENRTWWGSGYNRSWGGGWGGGSVMSQNVVQNIPGGNHTESDTGVALGQIKVNASVSVSFELE